MCMWRLEPDGRFFLDGEELLPLRDTDGLYWAQVPGDLHFQRALRSIADARVPARIRKHGLPWAPVRVRLVDYINATDTDHDFSEDPVLDGRSRITLAGRSYRVPRRGLSYFAFTARTVADAPAPSHREAERPRALPTVHLSSRWLWGRLQLWHRHGHLHRT